MGIMYKKEMSSVYVIGCGTFAILGVFVLLLFMQSFFASSDITTQVYEMSSLYINKITSSNYKGSIYGLNVVSNHKEIIHIIVKTLPALLIVCSFLFAVMTHGVSRRVLFFFQKNVSPIPPCKDWKLPRMLIYLFLILFTIGSLSNHSLHNYWNIVALNLNVLIEGCFLLQTIGFLFFFVEAKKWNSITGYIASMIVLLIPTLYIIGVVDLAFPIRETISRSKR